MKKRRDHDAGFMARVALEALKGERTVSELAAEYGVHPKMIHQWFEPLVRAEPNGEGRCWTARQKSLSAVAKNSLRWMRKRFGRCMLRSGNLSSPAIFVQKAQTSDLQGAQ